MSYEGGWFLEKNSQWKGQAMGLQLKDSDEKTSILLQTTTKIGQKLEVFDSETWGRVLLLDGVIQLTEKDECAYQEMLAHVPLNCWKGHSSLDDLFGDQMKRGANVLLVGGGDGGMARETLKYRPERVRKVTQVEIDGEVVEAAKKYFPTMSTAYCNGDEYGRYELKIDDAVNFVKERACTVRDARQAGGDLSELLFDVIVIDSSDPVGPAEKLFSPEFYADCCEILSEQGVMGAQGECLWIHQKLMMELMVSGLQV
jgi:spermidine synthase